MKKLSLLSNLRKFSLALFLSNAAISFGISTEDDYISPLQQDSDFQEYLSQFPYELYKVYNVPGVGEFYIDNGNFDGIKDHIKNGRVWESYIIKQMEKYIKPNTLVIDIGAHIGSLSIPMANLVGKNGKVFSFECRRNLLRELIMNSRLNSLANIIPMNFWICDEEGIIKISPYSLGGASVGELPAVIERKTLDSFNFEGVSLIKIDVECTEDQVLDGAIQTIMNNRPAIIIELMGGFGPYENATQEVKDRIDHTINKLNALEYDVSRIYIDDYLALPKEMKYR